MKPKTISELSAMGGRARATKLTAARRVEIAKRASKAAQIARLKKSLDLAGKVS